MKLYAAKRCDLFVLFAPCVLITAAPLLLWSVFGLLLVVPGILGMAGLGGLVLGWFGLLSPDWVGSHRTALKVLLVMGLGAAVLGVAIGLAAGLPSERAPDLGYLGLAGSSLSYGCVGLLFLKGLPNAHVPCAPAPDADVGELSMDEWSLAMLVAMLPPLAMVGAVLYAKDHF